MIPTRVAAAFYRGPEVYNGPNQPPKKMAAQLQIPSPTKNKGPAKKDVVEEILDDLG